MNSEAKGWRRRGAVRAWVMAVVAAGAMNLVAPVQAAPEESFRMALQSGSHGSGMLSYSPSGDVLLSMKGSVKLWDASNGVLVREYVREGDEVVDISGGAARTDAANRNFEAEVAQRLLLVNGSVGTVAKMALNDDWSLVVHGGAERKEHMGDQLSNYRTVKLPPLVEVLDIATGEVVRTFTGPQTWRTTAVAISPKRRYVAAAFTNDETHIWDLRSGKLVHVELTGSIVHWIGFDPAAKHVSLVMGEGWSGQTGMFYTSSHKAPTTEIALPSGEIVAEHNDLRQLVKFVRRKSRSQELGADSRLSEMPGYSSLGEHVSAMAVKPDGSQLAFQVVNFVHEKGILAFIDTQSGQIRHKIQPRDTLTIFVTCGDSSRVALGFHSGRIEVWDMASVRKVAQLGDHQSTIEDLDCEAEGTVLLGQAEQQTTVWNVDTGKRLLLLDNSGHGRPPLADLSSDGQWVGYLDDQEVHNPGTFSQGLKYGVFVQKLGSNRPPRRLGTDTMTMTDRTTIRFSEDGRYLVVGDLDKAWAFVWSVAAAEVVAELGVRETQSGKSIAVGGVSSIAFSPNGQWLAIGYPGWLKDKSGSVAVFSVPEFTLKEVFQYEGTVGSRLQWRSNDEFVVSAGGRSWVTSWPDGEISVVGDDIGSGAFFSDGDAFAYISFGILTIADLNAQRRLRLVSSEDEWVAYTNDGYFMGSRGSDDLVAGAHGLNGARLDQLALVLNRPDKILQHQHSKDTVLVDHYQNWYHHRLSKYFSNFGTGKVPGEEWLYMAHAKLSDRPNVDITGQEVSNGILEIKGIATTPQQELAALRVVVDGVPIHAGVGRPISGNKADFNEAIHLASGVNTVELSAVDVSGKESPRIVVTARGPEPDSKPSLFYVGLGVSDYTNPDWRLRYAHKDAEDLAKLFGKMTHAVDLRPLVLTDDALSQGSLKQIRDHLSEATVNDLVVVFIAGHGVRSQRADAQFFYLLPNSQLDELEGTALSFEAIESVLEGLPARQKLMLIDTCESGEFVPGVSNLQKRNVPGMSARKIRGMSLQPDDDRRSITEAMLDRNRYIYNDISGGTGAVFLTSSQAGEASYERDDLKNGVFTEAIIQGILRAGKEQGTEAEMPMSELAEWVREFVVQHTEGAQNPSSDRSNPHQQILLPVAVP